MMLPAFEAFCAHALQEEGRECCGLIVNEEYIPCRNVAENPAEDLVMHPEDQDAAEDRGPIQAVCHSHPGASPDPSPVDRVVCAEGDVPWFILGAGNALQRLDPTPIPLLDRPFRYGWSDCYSLVRDYYGGLLDYPREEEFWAKGHSPYLEHAAEGGFRPVPISEGRPGDMILMRIESEIPNHAGVLLEGGRVLHHLYGQLSRIDDLTRYLRRVTHVLRRGE